MENDNFSCAIQKRVWIKFYVKNNGAYIPLQLIIYT